MKSRISLLSVALLVLAACATQEPMRVAQADCRGSTVSVAGGQPLKIHYQYDRRDPADMRTDEHRLHHPGSCR